MSLNRMRTVASRLALASSQRGTTVSDAELLTRFLEAHDETAFEGLVARHLPAVRAVCRSLLRDPNDTDDAVQATFLILVRRAGALRDRLALGAWLCRVAWRTANRLRWANARRAERHADGINPDATPGRSPPACGREDASVLHEEIGRLPERYRLAVLACYATGTPTAEAATRLGWPRGTLLTRLAWARRRLRDRLAKRGIALSAGFTSVFTTRISTADGAVVAARIAAAATATAVDDPIAKELVSERVSSLTEGVVRTMIGAKVKLMAAIGFVTVALLGLGLGRMTAGPVDTKNQKPEVTANTPLTKTPDTKRPAHEAEPLKAVQPVIPEGAGNELVIRRPQGSFTREVPPYGRGTVTFTENRMHIHATVNIEKTSVTISADADYSMNRESMVYGIITAVDILNAGGGEEAAELAATAAWVNDTPFAFRVRVEDDAITIKDIKVGPFGSPLFVDLLKDGGSRDLFLITGLVSGKFKADPNPGRNSTPFMRPEKR